MTTTTKPSIIFCGSFLEFSVQVGAGLIADDRVNVVGVITTPPQPQGRKKLLTPTPVQQWAEALHLPVLSPHTLDNNSLAACQALFGQVDYLVTAGYGKLLPEAWLHFPQRAALNLHFSLLPKFRGANPAEWALAMGENETGITLIEMSSEFDTGAQLAQAVIPILPTATRLTIYDQLYQLGGQKLPGWIMDFSAGKLTAQPQPATSPTPYAKRLNRADGFFPWETLVATQEGHSFNPRLLSPALQKMLSASNQQPNASFIEKVCRAFAGFPSLWTEVITIQGSVRVKILNCALNHEKLQLLTVHIAGQAQPTAWKQARLQLLS